MIKNKAFTLLLITTVIFAIYIRAIGGVVFTNDLWADESKWLKILYTKGIFFYDFRPVGFMFFSKIIINFSIQHYTNLARIIPFISSVLTLLLIIKISLERFNNKIVCYFVIFSFCLNPYLITFAKEFKPYSLEILIFTYLLYFIHKISKTDHVSVLFIISLNFIWLFAYNSLFIYPLIFSYLFLKTLKKNQIKNLLLIFSALFIISSSLWLKVLITKNLGHSISSSYWGHKYGVFSLKESTYDIFNWYMNKTYDLSKLLTVHTFIPTDYLINNFSNLLFASLILCGLIAGIINQKNRALAITSVAPVIVIIILNFLKIWPYGDFRTNLFLIPGLLILAGFGANLLANTKLLRHSSQAILIFFILSHLPYDFSFFNLKTNKYWAPTPQTSKLILALKHEIKIAQIRKEKIHLIIDWHTSEPLSLYTTKKYQDIFKIRPTGLENNLHTYFGGFYSSSMIKTYKKTIETLKNLDQCPSRIFAVTTKLVPSKGFIDFLTNKPEFIKKTTIQNGTYNKLYHPVLIELSHSCSKKHSN